MRKLLLFLMLLITSVSYSQDEYIEIGSDSNGHKFYCKILNYNSLNKSTSIWLKTVYPKGLKDKDGTVQIEPNGYMVQYQTYYCNKRMFDTVEFHIYNSKGVLIESYYDEYRNVKIIPDSTGEYIYNSLCSDSN